MLTEEQFPRGGAAQGQEMGSLPFTTDQFLGVFAAYNQAVWPIQIVGYILGIIAVALAVHPNRHAGRVISGILGLFWIWMGIAYHLLHFSTVNPAAIVFGIAFVAQGVLLLFIGGLAGGLEFRADTSSTGLVGAAMVVYAMVVYPGLGAALGHVYPAAPVFGVAPCPTVIFTFGLLLWATTRVPGYVLVIPFLWTLLGFSAAVSLGMREDLGLVIAGLLGTGLIVWRDRASGSRHDSRRPAVADPA